MGVRTAVTIEEYLHTSYEGTDREFRDGEVVERSMPDYFHGECQANLVIFFGALKSRRRLYPSTETRMRMPSNRVPIPDVSVFRERPIRVPDKPPLIAIEVLSPDDRMRAVENKLKEYKEWGIPHVWLIDPDSRRMYIFEEKLTEVATLPLPEFETEVTPADIFT